MKTLTVKRPVASSTIVNWQSTELSSSLSNTSLIFTFLDPARPLQDLKTIAFGDSLVVRDKWLTLALTFSAAAAARTLDTTSTFFHWQVVLYYQHHKNEFHYCLAPYWSPVDLNCVPYCSTVDQQYL